MSGCKAFKFNELTLIFDDLNYLWGTLYIVVGIFLAFAGNRFWSISIFIVTSGASYIILLAPIYQSAIKNTQDQKAESIIIIISLLFVSLIIGYLFTLFGKFRVKSETKVA